MIQDPFHDPEFIVTPWTKGVSLDPSVALDISPEEAMHKDILYRNWIATNLAPVAPTTLELKARGYVICAGPRFFCFVAPDGEVHYPDALDAFLFLLPWRETNEISN